MSTFRAIWPVLAAMTLDDAIDEASADLPRLCRIHRVRIVGMPRWALRRGSQVPGSGGAHTVLVLDAAAIRVERPGEDEPLDGAA